MAGNSIEETVDTLFTIGLAVSGTFLLINIGFVDVDMIMSVPWWVFLLPVIFLLTIRILAIPLTIIRKRREPHVRRLY